MANAQDQSDPTEVTPPAAAGSVVVPGSSPASTLEPAPLPQADAESPDTVTWTASEFVAHDKSGNWYVVLAMCTILLAAGIFLLTRDVVSVAVIIIGGAVLGIFASHKPRQLEYVVDRQGIEIDAKHHRFDEFRSFSVAREGAFSSLVFMPLRRFAVPLTIYYAPNDEEQILNIVSTQLPFEEHKQDLAEAFMKRIRF